MVFACLFLHINALNAQAYKPQDWEVIVKFAPLVLLEPEGGYQIGFETPISEKWSMQNEFAYLCYTWDMGGSRGDNELKKFNGYALKTEARYYFFDGDNMEGLYVGPQFQYKYVYRHSIFTGFVDQWNSSQETIELKHYKEVAKLNVKMGFQTVSKGGFAFDMYCGAGGRMAWSTTKPGGYEDIFFVQEEIPLNVMLGFRFGWAF